MLLTVQLTSRVGGIAFRSIQLKPQANKLLYHRDL